MNEYDENLIRLRRNVEGLQSAMKFFEERYKEDAKKIEHLQHTVTDLTSQMQSIAQSVAILRATTMGRGPTAR